MGQLLSVGLLDTYQHQVTPRGHHKSQIISSHPSVFATIFLLSSELCCQVPTLYSREYAVGSECDCVRSGGLEVWIFTSPDQKITV